jgi:protein ImuB
VFLPQLTEQLQRTEFDRSVIAVSLKIDQVLEHQPGNQVLFGQQEQNQQDWQTLLGILSARLGEKAVCRLQSQEDHRPEKAWRRVSLDRPYKKQQTQKTDEQTNQRPLWLLLKPVAYSGSLKRLKRLSDHERIEAGWWQGKDARRDYCSVKTPSGAKVWLYQDICQQMNSRRQAGQQVMQQTRSMWYVHGLFA